MSKEKKIQEYGSKQLIDELSKMPPMVIATAYLYAINDTSYGVDVTEKWLTATQNASALEKAYKKGYYDALQRQVESRDWINLADDLIPIIDEAESDERKRSCKMCGQNCAIKYHGCSNWLPQYEGEWVTESENKK